MEPWDYITWSEMLFDLAICFYNHHWHLKAMQSPNQYMVLETYVDEKNETPFVQATDIGKEKKKTNTYLS